MSAQGAEVLAEPGAKASYDAGTGQEFGSVFVDATDSPNDVLVGIGQGPVDQASALRRVIAGTAKGFPVPPSRWVSFRVDPEGVTPSPGQNVYWAAAAGAALATTAVTAVTILGGTIQLAAGTKVVIDTSGGPVSTDANVTGGSITATIDTSGGPVSTDANVTGGTIEATINTGSGPVAMTINNATSSPGQIQIALGEFSSGTGAGFVGLAAIGTAYTVLAAGAPPYATDLVVSIWNSDATDWVIIDVFWGGQTLCRVWLPPTGTEGCTKVLTFRFGGGTAFSSPLQAMLVKTSTGSQPASNPLVMGYAWGVSSAAPAVPASLAS